MAAGSFRGLLFRSRREMWAVHSYLLPMLAVLLGELKVCGCMLAGSRVSREGVISEVSNFSARRGW